MSYPRRVHPGSTTFSIHTCAVTIGRLHYTTGREPWVRSGTRCGLRLGNFQTSTGRFEELTLTTQIVTTMESSHRPQ